MAFYTPLKRKAEEDIEVGGIFLVEWDDVIFPYVWYIPVDQPNLPETNEFKFISSCLLFRAQNLLRISKKVTLTKNCFQKTTSKNKEVRRC